MLQLYNYYSSSIHFQCRIRRRKRSQTKRGQSDDPNQAFTVLFPLSEQVQLCSLFSDSDECMAIASPSITTVVLLLFHAVIDLCNYVCLSVKIGWSVHTKAKNLHKNSTHIVFGASINYLTLVKHLMIIELLFLPMCISC